MVKQFGEKEVLFGADPEVLLVDDLGIPHGAWEITPGTKEKPEMLKDSNKTSLHSDGVALEYNFPPTTYRRFEEQHSNAHNQAAHRARQSGLSIKCVASSGSFKKEALMHPLVQRIGCDPDFCAYDTDSSISRATPAQAMSDTKFFGGHFHIGYDKSIVPPWALIRMVEGLWYLPNIGEDNQGPRRGVYGLAGIFREKEYGVEYRTPSNFWVNREGWSAAWAAQVYRIVRGVSQYKKEVNRWFNKAPWQDVQICIDSYDIPENLNLYKVLREKFPAELVL